MSGGVTALASQKSLDPVAILPLLVDFYGYVPPDGIGKLVN